MCGTCDERPFSSSVRLNSVMVIVIFFKVLLTHMLWFVCTVCLFANDTNIMLGLHSADRTPLISNVRATNKTEVAEFLVRGFTASSPFNTLAIGKQVCSNPRSDEISRGISSIELTGLLSPSRSLCVAALLVRLIASTSFVYSLSQRSRQ